MMKKITPKTAAVLFTFATTIILSIAAEAPDRKGTTNYFGARSVGPNCIMTNVVCSDINSNIICRDASNDVLYKPYGITGCPDQLWKPLD